MDAYIDQEDAGMREVDNARFNEREFLLAMLDHFVDGLVTEFVG